MRTENTPSASGRRGRLGFDAGGEEDAKARALAGFGMDVQAAARFLEQAMDDGQSEAGAFAGRLGGEIGLKYLRQHVRRHAGAVVPHRQLQQRRRVGEALPEENPVGPAHREDG